jgi:5-hydroxyisourate hydrolase-like protein (transthyretin family)
MQVYTKITSILVILLMVFTTGFSNLPLGVLAQDTPALAETPTPAEEPTATEEPAATEEPIPIEEPVPTEEPQNLAPTITLLEPAEDAVVTQGEMLRFEWQDDDPDDNALISIAYDLDDDPLNDEGHTWIEQDIEEDLDEEGDEYEWDTTDIPEGEYYLWVEIIDGSNPAAYSLAPGKAIIQEAAPTEEPIPTEEPQNLAPTISGLELVSTTASGPDFILTVNGTGFADGASTVKWNGSDRTTSFISDTQLMANINALDIETAGTASVTVFNAAPGGGISNALSFEITPSFTLDGATDGTISGTVTDAGGVPIEDIVVLFDGPDYGGATCTDASGDYTLTMVPYDVEWRVHAAPSGSSSWCGGPEGYLHQYWENAYNWDDATVLVLNAGTPSISGIDFALEMVGSITGVVTDAATGDPLQDVQVCVSVYGDYSYAMCYLTAADGSYTASGLASNDYRVEARKSGYAVQFYQNAMSWDDANRVAVVAGAATSGIDFSLQTAGTISGTVTDAVGIPIANIDVSLDGPPGYHEATCTDASGNYSITTAAYDVEWRVSAASSSFNWCGCSDNYIEQYWENAPDWDNATVLVLDAGTPFISGIDFALEPGGSITGVVTDAATGSPVEDVQVCVSTYDDHQFIGCVQTAADGSYTAGGLVSNDYRVSASKNGYAFQYYQDASSWGDADRVAVVAGAATSGIDFSLQTAGTISGTVTDAGGVPIANMNVSLDGDGFGDGTCTDASGNYSFTTAAYDVEWRVRAAPMGFNWCGGSEGYIEQYWENAPDWDNATVLVLDAGTPSISGIDFALEPGGSITGVVTEEATGDPLQDVEVCVSV